jgi:hypothetical protein
MKIFDCIRRVLKRKRKNRKEPVATNTGTEGSFTLTSQSGLYFSQPQSQPVITFQSGVSWSMLPDSAHQLIGKTVGKIDEKSISDYEFREWLRDNLSSCEYQSENGPRKYAKPDDTRPISVIDAMLEVK